MLAAPEPAMSHGTRRRRGAAHPIRPEPAWRAVGLVVALAWTLSSVGCAAHLPRTGEPLAFLERSTISTATQHDQAFEARPAVHVVLHNGLEAPELLEQGGTATVALLSFLGDFRIWRFDSAPVRTPTYEPRARLQIFHVALLGAPEDPLDPVDRPHRLVGALSFDFAHRSNGADGCALADHVRVGKSDFACEPTTDPPSTALNVRDGSFTTNYGAAGLGVRWFPGSGAVLPAGSALSATTTFEWNFPCHLDACMPTQMRARYGTVRALWSAEAELPLPVAPAWTAPTGLRVRVGAEGSVHLATADGRRPWTEFAAEVAVLHQVPRGLDLGLFVRRHQGPDYLNIHFEERLDAWIIGLVVDPSPASALVPSRAP